MKQTAQYRVMDLVAISGRARETAEIKVFYEKKYFLFQLCPVAEKEHQKFPFSSFSESSASVFCHIQSERESIEHAQTYL